LGSKNILWSSHFPLTGSSWPNTGQQVEQTFAGVPENERQWMRWENAADLYSLK
jgi:predicted TIM-barrel fold metal-dependent hydrolase